MIVSIPDPMRRFVSMPHGKALSHRWGVTRIESNDATFADDLFERLRTSALGPLLQAVAQLNVVVEHSVVEDGNELTHVDAGPLRTLLCGTTTMLIYDRDSRELLAFVAQGMSGVEFFNRLLPAIVCPEASWTPA